MPRLVRWLIRSALICLVAALVLGAVRALSPGNAWLAGAWPVYLHLLVLGWLSQLVTGVAYWMFPRVERGAAPTDWRGWAVFALLNAGLVIRVIAEPTTLHGPWLPFAAVLQFLAMTIFAWSIWPRVRGR
ncbi:MAG TPA: hypothetical protein VFL88_00340 [Gemmatimonadales bacterium]|nr:hypothetical protein [Gemmatimonadales bacterium]